MRRFLILLAISCLLLVPSGAQAATPGSGLRISPVRQDVTLAPGSSQTVNISVQNLTAETVTVQSVTSDFTASNDETGQPQLITDAKNKQARDFSGLAQPIEPFTLEGGQRLAVPLQLSAPADAVAGGYYGAVRFAASTAQTTQGATLTASTGTIFLVTVPGTFTQKLTVAGLTVGSGSTSSSLFMSPPSFAQVRFRNDGDIHLQPYGKLTLKNWSGKTIGQYEVNTTNPRGSVLPASTRKFSVALKNEAKIGVYNVEGSFSYGSSGQVLTAKQRFYVVPYQLLIAIGSLILLLVFVIPLAVSQLRKRRQARDNPPA